MRRRLSVLVLAAALAAQPAAADEPPPEAVLAELPFLDSDQTNRIYVDLAPEGSARPLRLMLDTGASHSVMTPRAARELGVRVRRLKRDPYRRATVLGRDLLFYVDTRSSDTASKTGWEYGILGGNFLREYVVELDFGKRRVRFLDADRYAVPEATEAPEETVLPLRIVGNRPGVEVSLEGESALVLLDTGAPMGLLVAGDWAERAGVEHEPLAGLELGGVLGPIEASLGEAERLAFGPFALSRIPVLVAPKGLYNQGFPSESVLGYDVLAGFALRIDYRRGRLWLRRRPEAAPTFLGADYALWRESGALLVPLTADDGSAAVGVLSVDPEGAAADWGLRAGDAFALEGGVDAIARAVAEGRTLAVERDGDGAVVAASLSPATGAGNAGPVGAE